MAFELSREKKLAILEDLDRSKLKSREPHYAELYPVLIAPAAVLLLLLRSLYSRPIESTILCKEMSNCYLYRSFFGYSRTRSHF